SSHVSSALFSHCLAAPRDLLSFPTRRSSDLALLGFHPHRPAGRFCQPFAFDRFPVCAAEAPLPSGAEAVCPDGQRVCLRLHRVRSEEHTSESSHVKISYAVFCLKKKKKYVNI